MSANTLISRFDELRRLTNPGKESYLEEFLCLTTNQEEYRLKWFNTLSENRMLKKLVDEEKKESINLEAKLTTAQQFLKQRKKSKIRAEKQRMKNERQLQMARNCLFTDTRHQIHIEMKEKLKFLNSPTKSRLSNDYNQFITTQELNSTGSILSDQSYSCSDDDLDVVVQKKCTYKKHSPSEIM